MTPVVYEPVAYELGPPVNSRTRPSFWRAYALFAQNPEHPSLRFKKLAGYDRVWSVRINAQYRAVGERDGDTVVSAWIGTHNEFDNLFG